MLWSGYPTPEVSFKRTSLINNGYGLRLPYIRIYVYIWLLLLIAMYAYIRIHEMSSKRTIHHGVVFLMSKLANRSTASDHSESLALASIKKAF